MCEAFLGEIRMVAFNFPPRGWAECKGQSLSIADNQALFSLLGVQYGGDGRTTFGLPDLRGRAPIGDGQAPGLRGYPQGDKIGTELNILSIAQLPPQQSKVNFTKFGGTLIQSASSEPGEFSNPTECFPAKVMYGDVSVNAYASEANTKMKSEMVDIDAEAEVQFGGQSQGINNIQPSIAMKYIICLQGTFPPRS